MNRHGNLSRFRSLSEAVQAHERAAAGPPRPRDETLYATLEEIERSLPHRDRPPERPTAK